MKKMIAAFLMFSIFAIPLSGGAVYAQFDPLQKTCESAQNSSDAQAICDASSDPSDPTSKDDGIIVTLANLLAIAAGVIAVFVIVISGIRMILSGGDPSKVATSRNTIIYTSVGVFVVLLARTIVVFIITSLI